MDNPTKNIMKETPKIALPIRNGIGGVLERDTTIKCIINQINTP